MGTPGSTATRADIIDLMRWEQPQNHTDFIIAYTTKQLERIQHTQSPPRWLDEEIIWQRAWTPGSYRLSPTPGHPLTPSTCSEDGSLLLPTRRTTLSSLSIESPKNDAEPVRFDEHVKREDLPNLSTEGLQTLIQRHQPRRQFAKTKKKIDSNRAVKRQKIARQPDQAILRPLRRIAYNTHQVKPNMSRKPRRTSYPTRASAALIHKPLERRLIRKYIDT